jgi:uncharacterized membrane protein YeiB
MFGIFLMFYSAFMLTAYFGMENIASNIVNNQTSISDEQKDALSSFLYHTHFIAIFVSFLFGGVGVNAFSKALSPIDNDTSFTINKTIIIHEFNLERKSTKASLVVATILIIIALIKVFLF